MKKIYADTYTVLLDKKNRVIAAYGTDEWKEIYKPAKDLKFYAEFFTWEKDGWMASNVKPSSFYMKKEKKQNDKND